MAIAIEHVIAASSIKGVGRQFLLRCIDDCSDASEIKQGCRILQPGN